MKFSKREFLGLGAVVGCSIAAAPFVTPIATVSVKGDRRLVVIVLRGAMDGIDVLRPWGDPEFTALRPNLSRSNEADLALSGFYGLHPALAPLIPLWKAGELGFVQATSTPYRKKRSHFDGQDILEAGTISVEGAEQSSGWLNRLLPHLGPAESQTAFAIGRERMQILSGDAPFSNWSPEVDMALSEQGLRLLELTMRSDPKMAASMAQAVLLANSDGDPVALPAMDDDGMGDMLSEIRNAQRGKAHLRIADFAAEQLKLDTRIVSFSISGWDTHANQHRALQRPLSQLAETLLHLKSSLGQDAWQQTTVLCMTEFGRTVRENGNRGTDHGTGGTMIMAGGAVRGGQIYGDWPGLSEASLYERRDLLPTSDIRSWAAMALRQSFSVSTSVLEDNVFPSLVMSDADAILR